MVLEVFQLLLFENNLIVRLIIVQIRNQDLLVFCKNEPSSWRIQRIQEIEIVKHRKDRGITGKNTHKQRCISIGGID